MTNSEQIQHQTVGYMKQVQAATLTFVNTISESGTSVLRQAGGVGANIDAPPPRSSTVRSTSARRYSRHSGPSPAA